MYTTKFLIQLESFIVKGGGDESEGEVIEVVELSIPELKDYMRTKEVPSPSSFLHGVSWFLLNKSEYC